MSAVLSGINAIGFAVGVVITLLWFILHALNRIDDRIRDAYLLHRAERGYDQRDGAGSDG